MLEGKEEKTKAYIGVDNGVTGTIGIIHDGSSGIRPMPVKTEQSYTKARQQVTRVDWPAFIAILDQFKGLECLVLIERPMVNPGRFKASASALRCLEAVLIAVETRDLPRQYVDSREWQREMLPKGTTSENLKRVSLDIGKRLFPGCDWKGLKDADSLLMAEWARRKGL
jgi:hypothetical protein